MRPNWNYGLELELLFFFFGERERVSIYGIRSRELQLMTCASVNNSLLSGQDNIQFFM